VSAAQVGQDPCGRPAVQLPSRCCVKPRGIQTRPCNKHTGFCVGIGGGWCQEAMTHNVLVRFVCPQVRALASCAPKDNVLPGASADCGVAHLDPRSGS